VNLRPYQKRAVEDVVAQLGDRPVLTMPTGSGKTVTASHIVAHLGKPTLWLAHRRELVQQAADTLNGYGLKAGVLMAGEPTRPGAQVQVASVQTAVRRDPVPADLVVIDECHHVRATTYKRLLDRYPRASVLGLTATPFRTDGKGLGDAFGSIVVAAYPDELIRDGYLVEPIVYAPADPMLKGTNRAGEYTEETMFRAMSKPKITGNIVRTWQARGRNGRTICFAVNVKHSQSIVAEFRKAGVPSEHLDGKTAKGLRDAILYRLRKGVTKVVSNVGVVNEGYDLPALEVAIIARPTASLCWHLQAVGRIMRASPAKLGAIVLDHAGNHIRHGMVTQRLEYSLDDAPVRKGDGDPSASKRCPECFLVVPLGGRECPECGYEFVPSTREIRHVEGELVRLNGERPSVETQQEAWGRIEWRRKKFGYKPGWSIFQFERFYGFKPLVVAGQIGDPAGATHGQKYSVWLRLEEQRRDRGHKPGWTGYQFKAVFGHWPRFAA